MESSAKESYKQWSCKKNIQVLKELKTHKGKNKKKIINP